MNEISRMTKIITFKRQLWPQPPTNAHPYWWGLGDLSFHDRDGNTLWHQKIVEAQHFRNAKRSLEDNGHRGFYCMEVQKDPHFGWCIVFQTSHDIADSVWNNLFGIDEPEIWDFIFGYSDQQDLENIEWHMRLTKWRQESDITPEDA